MRKLVTVDTVTGMPVELTVAGLPVLISKRLFAMTGQRAGVVDTNSLGGIATETPLSAVVIGDRIRRIFRVRIEKADVPFVQQPSAFQAIDTTA